jgi:DNA-binding SARP family transcriptional activator
MRERTIGVQLLGRCTLTRDAHPVTLSAASARVVAFLALHRGPQPRTYVAGHVWPDISEARARANLRNAIWRTQPLGEDVLACDSETVALAPGVLVDVESVREAAQLLQSGAAMTPPFPQPEAFGRELLTDWYDDWVLFERERLKQLCVHALEALSDAYRREGDFIGAIDCALLAVQMEPLRESAHRAVSRVHIAEGNLASARQQFDRYARLARDELGVMPSDDFVELIAAPKSTRMLA